MKPVVGEGEDSGVTGSGTVGDRDSGSESRTSSGGSSSTASESAMRQMSMSYLDHIQGPDMTSIVVDQGDGGSGDFGPIGIGPTSGEGGNGGKL